MWLPSERELDQLLASYAIEIEIAIAETDPTLKDARLWLLAHSIQNLVVARGSARLEGDLALGGPQ